MKRLFSIIILVFVSFPVLGQEVNIVPFLKDIEAGNIEKVKASLPELISENPSDPSVQFLDAVLIEDGDAALDKYKSIVRKYPKSRFADAALYRIFSYNFAVGLYSRANENLQKLKTDYPRSPYIRMAERKIPKEIRPVSKPVNETQKTAAPANGKYTIQVGAFMNLDNAKNLRENFSSEGYEADVKPKTVGASILNVVYVGKFKSRPEAAQALDDIFNKFKIKGRVVESK